MLRWCSLTMCMLPPNHILGGGQIVCLTCTYVRKTSNSLCDPGVRLPWPVLPAQRVQQFLVTCHQADQATWLQHAVGIHEFSACRVSACLQTETSLFHQRSSGEIQATDVQTACLPSCTCALLHVSVIGAPFIMAAPCLGMGFAAQAGPRLTP